MQLDALPTPDPRLFQTATLEAIPDGPAGTSATLDRMRDLVRAARVTPAIIHRARAIVAGVRPKNWAGEAAAIQRWVQSNIRYTRDVRGVETLTPPAFLLHTRQGDCDDQAMLAAALLEAIGHPTRLVAGGRLPWAYSHVWTETRIGPRWLAVETTQPWPLGRTPKLQHRMPRYV